MPQEYTGELERLLAEGVSKIDAAHAVIQKMLIDNLFSPGQVVSERSLSMELGISRTPVRAALNKLVHEGYLEMKSDVCTIVADLSIKDILEIYEMREALECMGVELFTRRRTPADEAFLLETHAAHQRAVQNGDAVLAREMDNQLHLAIAKGSQNRRLLAALKPYIDLSHCSAALGTSYEPRYERTLVQHKAVIDAILQNEPALAAQCLKAHFADIREYFKCEFLAKF